MHAMLGQPLRFRRDHRFTFDHASDYLDGDLDGSGRARVEQHARSCPGCHEFLGSLGRTIAALRELRALDGDADSAELTATIIARLRAER